MSVINAPESARGTKSPFSGPDALAIAILLLLTAVVAWHRFTYDSWLGRHDLLVFFLPWYGYLGDRLSAGEIPGWNPYLFSGTPATGDPESGWMYLPAMVSFMIFGVATAMKVMILIQLLIAGMSTYVFGRVLGMGGLAAFAGAMFYEFGPFLFTQTSCCTVGAQTATWIPLAFLGVELGLRARSVSLKLAAWFVAGLAISQYFSAWLGQGVVNALLLTGGWVVYRSLVSPPHPWSTKRRLVEMVTTGPAVLVIGLGLSLAGLLPRLSFNAQSINPGGDYTNVPGHVDELPLPLPNLVQYLFIDRFPQQSVALGGTVIVLGMLAIFLAGHRYAVPFFLGTTLIVYSLTLDEHIVHHILYLIPQFETVHEHSPSRILWSMTIGPAMLAAATVQMLPSIRGRSSLSALVILPIAVVAGLTIWMSERLIWTGWPILIAASAVTLTILLVTSVPHHVEIPKLPIAHLAAIGILVLGFVFPTGKDIYDSIIEVGDDPGLRENWSEDAAVDAAVQKNLSHTDPGGAGQFLQRQLEAGEPFRYIGYGSRGMVGAEDRSYPGRRLEEPTMSLLVNGRPMLLGIPQPQGYNPLQLKNYSDYVGIMNGRRQNYHYLDLLASGVTSPLLDMLGTQYIVIDVNLLYDRYDTNGLLDGTREVFRNNRVAVFENPQAYPMAWIVHDLRPNLDNQGLRSINSGAVDGRRVAFVDGEVPGLSPRAAPDPTDSVTFETYEPERIVMHTNVATDGFLVTSEMYADGWNASIDGERVDVYETNGTFRGVVLSAGEHEVEMRYEPVSLTIGLWSTGFFSLAGLLVWLAAAASWLRGTRRSPSVEPDVATDDAPAPAINDEQPPTTAVADTGAPSPSAPKILSKRKGG